MVEKNKSGQPIQHIKAIALITEKGEQTPLTGIIANPPKITPKGMQHIKTGLDISQLLNTEMSVIQKHLDFDRGMIMLTKKEEVFLYNAACYGYSDEHKKLLQQK